MNKAALQKATTIGSAISFLLFLLSFAFQAQAYDMTNNIYKIQAGNFNSFSGKASGSGKNITFTSGQTAVGLYSKVGVNYKVRAGFQYIYSIIPFSFSISSVSINFGSLNPGEPISRTNTLTVSNGSAFGYQVTAAENHELLAPPSGQLIPNTTCDAGTCTNVTASAWTSPLTYGFGYRCDNISGTDCSTDFSNSTFYKQFSNLAHNQTPQVVMSSANVGRGRTTQITYKVNISATQAAGGYQNAIIYVATPSI
ncbi:MAG TPA: hypothetical protein VHE53_01085 [Patescibacteria group bacterium]|nr:hypothetical protein [Patescibacteria group bacterium]